MYFTETDNSPKIKPSIRERLGYKSTLKSENKETVEKLELNQKIEEKLLDPVLEARKRKFEIKEIQLKEGVIRLKPKDDLRIEKLDETKDTDKDKKQDLTSSTLIEKMKNDASINEDVLLEDDEIELESKIDLFSDEESGSENEGRFKAKDRASNKTSVLPFTKLVNGIKEKIDSPCSTSPKRTKVRDRPVSHSRIVSQKRLKHDESFKDLKKSRSVRSINSAKSDRHETPKKFDRKIEIRLKNPSKYDKEDKNDSRQGEKKNKNMGRNSEMENKKVNKKADEDEDFETEIIVENEDEIENTNDEGKIFGNMLLL